MTTLPPWWLVITMPPPHHLVNIVPFSSWRTGDARFPLQRWPSKEEAASEPPVTFLYLVLSLSRILSSSFISYIYSHLSLSCSYSFSIASSSSISFLLSRSLCSPPPTSDPRPTFVTTATSTISSPLQQRHPAAAAVLPPPPLAAAAASTLSLPLPLVPKPKETRDRFEFKLLNTRLPRVKSDTSARRWYDAISFSTRYWKHRRWCKNSPTFRSWLSFPKNSLIERDDGTWYEKSMTLFCPNFQDR